MLRGRARRQVLAELPASRTASRAGALNRAELEAHSGLAVAIDGARAVLTSGPEKSLVALGLATVEAAAGRRVCLLECDLRRPAIAAELGLATTPGLNEYLRGEAEAPKILQALVLAGPASAQASAPLTCIVAGASSPSPSSLLASERCADAIAMLRRAYDLLVIDGPSPADEPDFLRTLSPLVDSTLLCAEHAQLPKRTPASVTGFVVVG
jgi:Mrp family chromosome partitioning ATPase